MKTLKIDHDIAEEVKQGHITCTWRLFDDKDLSPGDYVELIDKVDPTNRDSWIKIGTAKINAVVEKQFGELTADDMAGHEPYDSRDQMLNVYRNYYGATVSSATPVKVIHFSLVQPDAHEQGIPRTRLKKVIM